MPKWFLTFLVIYDKKINGEINFKINPDFLKQAKDNVLIFSGIKTPKLDEILKNGQKKDTSKVMETLIYLCSYYYAGCRIWTCDLRVTSAMLYQLS